LHGFPIIRCYANSRLVINKHASKAVILSKALDDIKDQ